MNRITGAFEVYCVYSNFVLQARGVDVVSVQGLWLVLREENLLAKYVNLHVNTNEGAFSYLLI